MANAVTSIEPHEVARKAHELWVVARREGCRNRPIVRWGNSLWAIAPPRNWRGIRWVAHDGLYLAIELHGWPHITVWGGRWMRRDEWMAELVKMALHNGGRD